MLQKILSIAGRSVLAIVGLLMVAIGLWTLDGQQRTDEDFAAGFEALRQALMEGIPTVSAGAVDRTFNDRLVYLRGPLEYTPITDSVTGVTLPAGALRRIVEMNQWEERAEHTSTRTGYSYEYVRVWSEQLINSDDFHDDLTIGGEDHVNPDSMPSFKSEEIKTTGLRIGAWRLTESYAWRVAEWQRVAEEILYAGTTEESWTHAGGYVFPREESQQVRETGIGAVRVSYEYLPVVEGNYSVIGIARDGVLDDDVFAGVIGPPLIEPGNVDAEIMLSAAEEYADRGGAPTNGPFAWMMVGLLMSLRTLALPFPLLRGFTTAPFARRLLISAGAATALTAVAWIYFR